MNNSDWIAQVKELIKAGEHDKAAQLATKVLEQDCFNPDALWILANTSRFHPEKYKAIKLYTQFTRGEHMDKALAMLERYQENPEYLGQLEAYQPKWIKVDEAQSMRIDYSPFQWDRTMLISYWIGFTLTMISIVWTNVDEAQSMRIDYSPIHLDTAMLISCVIGFTLAMISRFIRWIFSLIIRLFSRKKPKPKKHN